MLIILIPTCLTVFDGCGKNIIGHPVMRETRQFPIPAVGNWATQEPYKMSRLAKGYGLFVFSYEIVRTKDTLTGIRIWEHRFKSNQGEQYASVGAIPATGWGPNPKEFGLIGATLAAVAAEIDGADVDRERERLDLEFEMTYNKGCITYGGRLVIAPAERGMEVQVEQHYDEDVGPILKHFKGQLKGVEVLSAPMRQRFVPLKR